VTRGEPRCVRSFRPRCRFLLLAQVCPTAIPNRPRHPVLSPTTGVRRVSWRLTRTGLWTERRTCPRPKRALFGRLHDECVRFAHADDVPLLGVQRAPVVAGAIACVGTSPAQTERTDQDPRSPGSPRRLPASRGSGCLPPQRRRAKCPRRPPAHAAHTFPPWLGTSALDGHCKRPPRDEPRET